MNEGKSVRCPVCGGWLLEKYGKTKAGKQKYRCLEPPCRRQFVAGSEHEIGAEVKGAVQNLLKQRTAPAAIAAAFPGKISLRWIYEIKRRMSK
jgi:transposase-like protein